MNRINLQKLIQNVLWLSAEGKVRKYYMENEKFQSDFDAMVITFVALAKINREEERIKVWSPDYQAWDDYSISEYKVPNNIALFNVLCSTDCVYTTEWKRRSLSPCGKRQMDMNLTLDDKKRVLRPKALEDIYALMELTAPLSWSYGVIEKQPIMLNDLKYWCQKEERKFTVIKYYNEEGVEVAPDDEGIVKTVPEEVTNSVFSMYESSGQLLDLDMSAAIQYCIESFDVDAFFDRREVVPELKAIERSLAMRTSNAGVKAVDDIKSIEKSADITNNSAVADTIMAEAK